jgi:hypothetical protein
MSEARKVATSKAVARGDAAQKNARVQAYKRLFSGNGTRDDADIVLSDLLATTGYFRPPNYAEWMARTKTPAGFELHCALQAARAEPMRHIMDYLALTEDQIIALEKAAREESRR